MAGKQLGSSDYELTTAKKQTKREKFLAEMQLVVPTMRRFAYWRSTSWAIKATGDDR